MTDLTEIEQRAFDRIVEEYVRRGIELTKEQVYFIGEIIKLANVHGDGFKRIQRMEDGKVFLVPVEDILLYGVAGWELDRYQLEEKK